MMRVRHDGVTRIPPVRLAMSARREQGGVFLARLVQIDYIGHIHEHREVSS